MRLWTFQNKKALSVLEDGIWYSNYDYSEHLKLVDEQFIQEDVKLPDGSVIETTPIYCFASMCGKYYPALSLHTIYSQYSTLVGRMRFNLNNMVMIELEVNEGQILSAKKSNKLYQEYSKDMPEDVNKYDKWKYLKVVDEDEICKGNFMQYVRDVRSYDDVECLIPFIDINNIVAIRTFDKPAAEGTYGTCKVETIYSNEILSPTFTDTIYVNGDGYPRVLVDNKLKAINSDFIYEQMSSNGMHGCFSYQTVEEVLGCCDNKTIETLRKEFDKRNLNHKEMLNITIGELFPNGLIIP